MRIACFIFKYIYFFFIICYFVAQPLFTMYTVKLVPAKITNLLPRPLIASSTCHIAGKFQNNKKKEYRKSINRIASVAYCGSGNSSLIGCCGLKYSILFSFIFKCHAQNNNLHVPLSDGRQYNVYFLSSWLKYETIPVYYKLYE